MPPARQATGPGRVNLIGDHTDYNLGVALPMAVGLGVTVEFERSPGSTLEVTSAAIPDRAAIIDVTTDDLPVASFEPAWARPVAAMATLVRPGPGNLHIESDLPMGAGLSSSAALCVALADVFGVGGSAVELARLCQEAERRAGSPVGAMDPLVCAGARSGHALLIDFSSMTTRQISLPAEAEVVVVDSGQARPAHQIRIGFQLVLEDAPLPPTAHRVDKVETRKSPDEFHRRRHFVVTSYSRLTGYRPACYRVTL